MDPLTRWLLDVPPVVGAAALASALCFVAAFLFGLADLADRAWRRAVAGASGRADRAVSVPDGTYLGPVPDWEPDPEFIGTATLAYADSDRDGDPGPDLVVWIGGGPLRDVAGLRPVDSRPGGSGVRAPAPRGADRDVTGAVTP